MVLTFNLPMHFKVRYKGSLRQRTLSLNVGLVKNARWYNNQIRSFHKECKKQLTGGEPKKLTHIKKITYYIGCSKRIDMMNVGSMVDKLFQDFLVAEKIIADDNISIVDKVEFIGEVTIPKLAYVRVEVEC